jgi:serine/threonine protein kinase/Tol biopolymer transport system component
MTPETYRQAAELFDRLRELPEADLIAALEAACGENPEVREQVIRLIEADREAGGSFLGRLAVEDAARLAAPALALPSAGTVIGNYSLGRQIGAGGMGVVFEGRDLRLERRVAIKILPSGIAAEAQDGIRRFQREARAASSLNHPHIVSIFDADFAQGYYYIGMEFVEGKTLRQFLAPQSPALDVETILEWISQIAAALGAAHEAGVIHRDIKPENIMVRPDGFVKVLDFGLAKLHEVAPNASRQSATVTRAGNLAGTIHYLSPEQILGEPTGPRGDLFSLGVVAYELATGVRPFEGPTDGAIFEAILHHTPLAPAVLRPGAGTELSALIMRAIEKDPVRRFQDAADLRNACRSVSRTHILKGIDPELAPPAPVVAEPATGPSAKVPPQDAPSRPSRFWVWAAVAAALMAAAATIVSYKWPPEARPNGITERQLTASFDAPVADAAISPDGSSVAYADADGLYLKLIASGEVHPLAMPANCRVFQIAWFPDSRDILVTAMPGQSNLGALWAISVFGGQPRLLREDTRDVSVSSDASQIAFTTNAQDGLWIMNADGSQAKKVASAREGQVFQYPAWQQERRSIIYLSKAHASHADPVAGPVFTHRSLESLDLETGKSTVVRKEVGDFCVLHDGRVIAGLPGGLGIFATDSQENQPRYLVRFDFSRDPYYYSRPSVSADGRHLVVLKTIGEAAVFAGRLVDGGKRLENVRRITSGGPESSAHAWTPDSRAIVFESNRENVYHIFSQRLDQRNPDRLVSGNTGSVAGRFSPDGRWLFYEARTDHNTLMRTASSGGPSRVVLDNPNMVNYYCTGAAANFCVIGVRDQEQLVFYRLDPNMEPPAGGFPISQLRELGRTDYHPSDWGISPDGSTIAMVRPDDHEGRIHFVALASQRETSGAKDVVVKGWTNFYTLNWALDGSGWYVSNQPASGEPSFLYVERRGNATILYTMPSSAPMWGVPSPDGRYLALCATPAITSAWLVENF